MIIRVLYSSLINYQPFLVDLFIILLNWIIVIAFLNCGILLCMRLKWRISVQDLAVRVGIKVAHMLETMEKKLHSMLFPFVILNYVKYGFELILEENLFH